MWVDSLDTLRLVARGSMRSQRAAWFHHGVGVQEVRIEGLDVKGLLYDLGVRDDRLLRAEVKNLNHTQSAARLFPTVDQYMSVRGAEDLLERIDWRV